MTPMNSEEITLCSGSVNQGGLSAFGVHIFIYALVSICLWYLHVFSMHWYFLIFSYYLTVLNWLSLVTLKSVEFTQRAGSLEWGGSICLLVSMTPMNSEEITLCSGSGQGGPSAFGVCIFIYALVFHIL